MFYGSLKDWAQLTTNEAIKEISRGSVNWRTGKTEEQPAKSRAHRRGLYTEEPGGIGGGGGKGGTTEGGEGEKWSEARVQEAWMLAGVTAAEQGLHDQTAVFSGARG